MQCQAGPSVGAARADDVNEQSLSTHHRIGDEVSDNNLMLRKLLRRQYDDECFRKVVLLGAGMDTRAWRLPLPEGAADLPFRRLSVTDCCKPQAPFLMWQPLTSG